MNHGHAFWAKSRCVADSLQVWLRMNEVGSGGGAAAE
jgi:hypothetical protein